MSEPGGRWPRLLANGFEVEFDPTQVGRARAFAYYRGRHTGARVELLTTGALDQLRARAPRDA